MPIPGDQTRSELTSTSNAMSSSATRTRISSAEELEQVWAQYIENSIASPAPQRFDRETFFERMASLFPNLPQPTRPPEHWVRDDLLFDHIATRGEQAIALPTTPPISTKAPSTFKEFSQRIESTE